jgi:hypothetical protein
MVNGKLFLVMGPRMGWSDDPADEPGWQSAISAVRAGMPDSRSAVGPGRVPVPYSQCFFLNTSSRIVAMPSITPSRMK